MRKGLKFICVAAVCSLVIGAADVTDAPRVSASTTNPAFFTYQAPGWQGASGAKVIALTFDDGPGPYTPEVLSVLQRYGVPATFFEIGANTLGYGQYTRQLALAGYPVEDHTWNHPDLATIPVGSYPYEIDQTQTRIEQLTGITPSCVRPPYNAWNTTVIRQLGERGLTTMSYSVDPKDWTLPGTQTIVARVVGAAAPGAVVDLHDGGGNRQETVDALPQIIASLRAEGFTFVSICSGRAVPHIAFQANTGDLWTWTGTPGTTGYAAPAHLGMAPGTTPTITSLPNGQAAIAFQANTGDLWTWTGTPGTTGYAAPANLGMATGTGPGYG